MTLSIHILLFVLIFLDNYTWLPIIITIFFLILIPVWIMIVARNEYVNDVLIHGWYQTKLIPYIFFLIEMIF